MGFTRYWRRPDELDQEKFDQFVQECRKICMDSSELISSFEVTVDHVRIDGQPGCEPFVVNRKSEGRLRDGCVSEFCKTQGLPYDAVVQRCLEALALHFPEVQIPMPS